MEFITKKSISTILPSKELFGLLPRTQRPLFLRVFPNISLVQTILLSLFGTILVSLLAQVKFPLPGNPVPVTLQGFGVLVLGGFLGWRWGLVSILIYYIFGLIGLPVFANPDQGNLFTNLDISEIVKGYNYVFMGVTGGYLLGFILATVFIGFIVQSGWNRGATIWAMLLGSFLIYIPAFIWLSVFDFGWPAEGELLKSALYPFIPGDLLKVVIASLFITGINNWVNKRDKEE